MLEVKDNMKISIETSYREEEQKKQQKHYYREYLSLYKVEFNKSFEDHFVYCSKKWGGICGAEQTDFSGNPYCSYIVFQSVGPTPLYLSKY